MAKMVNSNVMDISAEYFKANYCNDLDKTANGTNEFFLAEACTCQQEPTAFNS